MKTCIVIHKYIYKRICTSTYRHIATRVEYHSQLSIQKIHVKSMFFIVI